MKMADNNFLAKNIAQSADGIKYSEEYILNSRGLKLFTCKWIPGNLDPKALIFLCHGYAVECSITMRGTGIRLAKAGFAVYGMDYEGHGKSNGLQAYIPSFDELTNDCSDHFSKIVAKGKNKTKKRFLLGESMGGAVAIILHRKMPKFWDGAVLVAPMCKIAEKMRPHPVVMNLLTTLCKVIPTWKLIPTQDIIDSAIKNPEYREEVRNNPYCYKGKPRLKTGLELFTVSIDIEKRLNEVKLPFLIVHGEDDIVTDPSVSEALYNTASSEDKTFKLYPGMWHALTSGESEENIDLVFSDIISWLNERSISEGMMNTELQQKRLHDPHNLPSECKSESA